MDIAELTPRPTHGAYIFIEPVQVFIGTYGEQLVYVDGGTPHADELAEKVSSFLRPILRDKREISFQLLNQCAEQVKQIIKENTDEPA